MFGDEMMVSDDTVDSKLTRLSLAVAKDSGWYEVDLSRGEHYFWGKNEGCSILANTCDHTTVSEFCSSAAHYGCSDDHMYSTNCTTSLFTGNCPINLQSNNCLIPRSWINPIHTSGKDSLCLEKTVGLAWRSLTSGWHFKVERLLRNRVRGRRGVLHCPHQRRKKPNDRSVHCRGANHRAPIPNRRDYLRRPPGNLQKKLHWLCLRLPPPVLL